MGGGGGVETDPESIFLMDIHFKMLELGKLEQVSQLIWSPALCISVERMRIKRGVKGQFSEAGFMLDNNWP